MFEILGSVLTGGATGIIGSIIGQAGRFLETRQKLKKMKLEFSQELQLQEMQIEARSAELESESAIAEENAAASIKAASYVHDASYSGSVIGNILRFVRPILTFMLLGFSAYVFLQAIGDPAIKREISNQILFLTTTAVTWWFGDRSMKK
jgi:ABC-type protease/lipase transport system fused ATPase/permease subunit